MGGELGCSHAGISQFHLDFHGILTFLGWVGFPSDHVMSLKLSGEFVPESASCGNSVVPILKGLHKHYVIPCLLGAESLGSLERKFPGGRAWVEVTRQELQIWFLGK